MVDQQNSSADDFLVLMDKADGASFIIRIETLEGLSQASDDAIESSMAESLDDPKLQTRKIGRSAATIAGVRFNIVEYHIENQKFGKQVLRHCYARQADVATVLVLSWPQESTIDGPGVPAKHAALLDGLTL